MRSYRLLAGLAVMAVAAVLLSGRVVVSQAKTDPALEEEYDKKAKAADSFSAEEQYNLALWCEEKGLTERFEEHLFNAFLLNPQHAGAGAKLGGMLKDKQGKLAADDAKGHFELGEWCFKAGLKDEATRLFEKTVTIDPEHAGARAKLGFVKHGDKWVTVEEARKLQGTTESAAGAIGKALEIEFKKPFISRQAGPYMLFLQHEKSGAEYKLDAYVEAFTSFYEGIKEKFGDALGLPPKDRVITVAAVEDEEVLNEYFKRQNEPKGMTIRYERENKRLVMSAVKEPLRPVAHEGAHQFYYEAMKDDKAKTSLWVQEGIACFTEACKRNPDTLKFEFGTMNEGIIYKIQRAVKEKKNIPLAEFLEIKYEDWQRELIDFYLKGEKLRESGEVVQDDEPVKALERKRQQAWSIFYFLYNFEKGKYRSKLMDYLKLETSTGRSGLAAFKEVFGEPAVIEKEWLEYVPTMSAME